MKPRLILLLLLSSSRLTAQPDLLTEDLTSRLLDNESNSSSVEIISFELEQLLGNPLNINEAGQDELTATGLFTPFQVYSLLEYRSKYGPLFTLNELAVLPGFRREEVTTLLPFFTTSGSSGSIKPMRKNYLHNDLTVTSEFKAPRGEGYKIPEGDSLPAFEGSALKISLRYRGNYSDLDWGLSVEKDPGETLLYENKPQFITGFLRYRGPGLVREVTAGSFRIRTGLGLCNGIATGQGNTFAINSFRAGEIKPYASLNENNFNTGLALCLGSGKWETLAWASLRKRDILTGSKEWDNPSPDIFRTFDESGLNRTPGEQSGRNIALTNTFGLQLSRRTAHLTTGISANYYSATLNDSADSLLSLQDSIRSEHAALALFGLWFNRHITLFTETSVTKNGDFAFITGTVIQATSYLKASVVVRDYSRNYYLPEAEAYSLGGSVQNEKGLLVSFVIYPVKYTTLTLLHDFSAYPFPRYLCSLPSTGSRSMAELCFNPPGIYSMSVRYQEKLNMTTPQDELPGADPLCQSIKKSIRFDQKLEPVKMLSWNFRVEFSKLDSDPEPGWSTLAYQQITYHGPKGGKILLRNTLFNIRSWDTRIYSYEPGVLYSFSFPAYYGTGNRTTLVIKQALTEHAVAYLRVSRLHYNDKLVTGSGNDMIYGDKRWEMNFQLVLKL